jgi:hypothetical protein
VMGASRCADCHHEHHGARSMEDLDPKLCVDCHGKLKDTHPEAKQENISSFTSGHPGFKFPPVDEGIHFPHNIHMAKEGIRSPDAAVASGGKVVMQCNDCHELEQGRHFYKPVEMEKHCSKCHRLDFEPGRTSRQVPHGDVAGVLTTLREFYAGVALGAVPMAAPAPQTMMLRPGEKRKRIGPLPTVASAEWVTDSAEKAAYELFEKRVCHDCHEIQKTNAAPDDPAGIRGVTWTVKPVVQRVRWLPKSEFEHSRHASEKCERCHSAATSQLATDVLMPPIDTCRECHVAEPQPEKVTSGCQTCHGYHAHQSGSLAAASP